MWSCENITRNNSNEKNIFSDISCQLISISYYNIHFFFHNKYFSFKIQVFFSCCCCCCCCSISTIIIFFIALRQAITSQPSQSVSQSHSFNNDTNSPRRGIMAHSQHRQQQQQRVRETLKRNYYYF